MTQYKVGYGKPPKASQFNEESQAIREVGPREASGLRPTWQRSWGNRSRCGKTAARAVSASRGP
jgi:hypothetical protein